MSATSFTCPRCGRSSANPHDVENRYCGNCHAFVDDAPAAAGGRPAPLRSVVARDETGQRHAYSAEVARVFLEMEILRRNPVTGEFTIRSSEAFLASDNPHIAVCDLCSARPVVFAASVDDFVVRVGHTDPWRSRGGFLLCQACGALVLGGERDELLARAIEKHDRRIAFAIAILHVEFWTHFRAIAPLPQPEVRT